MNENNYFAKTVLSAIAKGVALIVGIPLTLAIGWLVWILILNSQQPSEADHKAAIALHATSKGELIQWLQSKDIKFSDQSTSEEHRNALLESQRPKFQNTHYISPAEINTNIPGELVPKVASVVTFTLTPRLEEFVLATSVLYVALFYDQNGHLVFKGYTQSYRGM